MSPAKARIIQWFVILLILTGGTLGYFYYQSHAAINQKAATNQGLVGYWSFDEGSGTQAGDASSSRRTGTLNNGTAWVGGVHGKAAHFDGSDDFIDFSSKAFGNLPSGSVSFWVKSSSYNDGTIMYEEGNGFNNVAANWASTSSSPLSFNLGSNTPTFTTAKINFLTNTWYHVVLTWDSTNVVSYVNGAFDKTTASSNHPNTTVGTYHTQFGRYAYGSDFLHAGQYFLGDLDEVRIYNRALSSTEITNLYNLGAAKVNASENSNLTNGLVGLWSFDGKDVSGTTAYDRSGQGNNGTLTNGPRAIRGKLGQALSFWPNGSDTNAYVNIGDPVSGALDFGSGDFAVGFWMKSSGYVSQGSSANIALSKKNNDGAGTTGYGFMYRSGNAMELVIGNGTTDYTITAPTATTNDNQWHHYMGFRSGSTMYLYIDGVQVGLVTVSGSVSTTTGLYVGSDSLSQRNVNGNIDDVRIYNRALSESEIRDLYQMGASDKVNSADAQTDPLEKGLTGYWKLDENTGTTTADASGNSNTGTLTNGPTWTTGRIGTGVTFDATDDYINIPHQSYLNSYPLTASVWFKTSSTTGIPGLINKYVGGSGNGYQIFMNSGHLCAWYFKDFSNYIHDGSTCDFDIAGYNNNTWHQATFVVDASGGNFYIDGSLKASRAWTGSASATTTTQPIHLGEYAGTYFPGSLDEARIYNRALSADEVAKLYQTTAPDNPDTSLKGYWSFNGPDVSGTTAYDRSGQGNNGTLTNGPRAIRGKLGQALSFDGTDDYITATMTTPAPNLTICSWVKPSIVTGQRMIVDGQGSQRIRLEINNSKFRTHFGYGSWGAIVDGATTLSANNWYFVCGSNSMSNTTTTLYVNGIQDGTGVAVAATSDTGIFIGRYSLNSSYNFQGDIDDVRIYDRALTATEVASLYNTGK